MNIGYVYALSDGEKTKVGYSCEPIKRTQSLSKRHGIKNPSIWISDLCEDARLWESNSHTALFDFHYKGEWFHISFDDAIEFICESKPCGDYLESINNKEKFVYLNTKSTMKLIEMINFKKCNNPKWYTENEIVSEAINLLHEKKLQDNSYDRAINEVIFGDIQ